MSGAYDEPLTLEMVLDCIERDMEQSEISGQDVEYNELGKLMSNSFTSARCLNKSFHIPSSSPYHKLNLSEIATFYSIMIELPSETLMRLIVTSQLSLLKRIRINLETPNDILFLIIILQNPLLYNHSLLSSVSSTSLIPGRVDKRSQAKFSSLHPDLLDVLERTVSILAHTNKKCKHFLLNWFARLPLNDFQPKVEQLNAYVAHRLTSHYNSRHNTPSHRRHHSTTTEAFFEGFRSPFGNSNNNSGSNNSSSSSEFKPGHARVGSGPPLPTSSTSAAIMNHFNQFRLSASNSLVTNSQGKKRRSSNSGQIKFELYSNDWKISSFIRMLALLFNANAIGLNKLAISSFYNTMVDYTDVTTDYDEWQLMGVPMSTLTSSSVGSLKIEETLGSSSPGSCSIVQSIDGLSEFSSGIRNHGNHHHSLVSFCQYPFLLSMGSKTQILEYDARRQMEYKAQEAFFGTLDQRMPLNPFFFIRVHRHNLVQESFEALEKRESDLKKGLRIEFIGEPGIDAGGLRKEWFLLLTRELFSPQTGLFIEEEGSGYFWFDTNTTKPLKYYQLTGTIIGLALYNSTILDINFPPIIFKKLLGCPYTLDDFITFRPSHGKSLKLMLDYEDDDFEETFSLNFCLYIPDSEGQFLEHELIPDGSTISVTKENRHDYVRRVMHYYLDVSICKQFDLLRDGFYKVAGGNSLTLFRPEEIELLIRGSPEPVDVDALRSVTKYQHWGPKKYDAENDPVIKWFWSFFKSLNDKNQRKLLVFVTGSDRIPATGIANMTFRITKAGEDSGRFPTSHTCFNQLCLYAYSSKDKLEQKVLTAINESQGFGIK